MHLYGGCFVNMKILNYLFGCKEKQAVSVAIKNREINFCHDFMDIPSLNFFGPFRRSRSGKWVISWSDSDDKNHIGGHRGSGFGRYVLCYENNLILQGELQRPNSGSVADNGTFAIEDWHFGNDLSGTFYVFSSTGQQLINRKFKANLYNSSLSDTGRFAICQTANSLESDDGNKLTAFDVKNGIELFSVQPPTGWAEQYKFIENELHFALCIKDIGIFRYDINGNFIDSKYFDTARLQCSRFDIIITAAEEMLKRPDLNEQDATDILESVKKALVLGANNDQYWKAISFKIHGVAHEFLCQNEEALAAFDEAVKINPKIGLKRKANSLRKKLQNALS